MGLCAIASKENSATLPFFILLYEWFFFQDLRINFKKEKLIWIGIGALAFTGIVIVYLGENPFQRILNTYAHRDFTMAERLLTEFRVVTLYISLLVYPDPARLNLDYDYPLSYSIADPMSTIFSMVMIVSLFCTAIYLAKQERLISFCILWYLGNLVIESSVIGLEIIFEHRNYLPSMLIFLFMTILIFRAFTAKWNAASMLTAIAVLFSIWTYQRNFTWENEIVFWKDIAAKSPNEARPYQNLAYSYQQQNKFSETIRYYRKSLEYAPHPVAYFNLGLALIQEKNYTEAAEAFATALKMKYRTPGVYFNLGYALSKIGEFEKALKFYERALAMNPKDNTIKKHLMGMKRFLMECRTPMECVSRKISMEPDNPALHYQRGMLFESQGDLESAQNDYEIVFKKIPEHSGKLYLAVINRFGLLLSRMGEQLQAIEYFKQGIRLAPDNPLFPYQVALMYASMQKEEDAIKWLDEAVKKGFKEMDVLNKDPRWQFLKNLPYYTYLEKHFLTQQSESVAK